MFMPNKGLNALIRFGMSSVDAAKGIPGASKGALDAVPFFKKVSGPAVISSCYCNAGFAELQDGNLDNAKKYFEQAKACGEEQLEEVEAYATSLAMLAELADHEGDITQAKALRAQAFALVQKMPDQTVVFACQATAIYACYLAMEGNPTHAREIITPAVTNASKQLSGRAVQCKYLAGMVELIDGEFEKSRAYFVDTIEDCISVAELKYRARSQRALGEISVVQGDLVGAKKHFDATAELCNTMGLPKHRLYSDLGCYAPNETFDGWTLYQEGHAMFRT
ncbi:hypothetical protein H0H93_013899 [Arthromyces matolae]|nr:hypothetical protein H0H93_013899 [Arthromyces matolae]